MRDERLLKSPFLRNDFKPHIASKKGKGKSESFWSNLVLEIKRVLEEF